MTNGLAILGGYAILFALLAVLVVLILRDADDDEPDSEGGREQA